MVCGASIIMSREGEKQRDERQRKTKGKKKKHRAFWRENTETEHEREGAKIIERNKQFKKRVHPSS